MARGDDDDIVARDEERVRQDSKPNRFHTVIVGDQYSQRPTLPRQGYIRPPRRLTHHTMGWGGASAADPRFGALGDPELGSPCPRTDVRCTKRTLESLMRQRTYQPDPDRIASQGYDSSTNLDAKYRVLRQHSVNKEQFESWMIAQLCLTGGETVLDIGCGQGRFLLPVATNKHGGVVVGCDIASGVMEGLSSAIQSRSLPAVLLVADACSLPFLDRSFDLVMANHMLYHADDIGQAVREAARVLLPDGQFLATTNSRRGMPELQQLHYATFRSLNLPVDDTPDDTFTLETGGGYLSDSFGSVDVKEFDSGFSVSTPEPILDYYKATQLFQGPMRDQSIPESIRNSIEPTFRSLAADRIRTSGGTLTVHKPVGGFIATR
jgi:ubiquinone/menaquinone biosynthesis C-methylase UbiE